MQRRHICYCATWFANVFVQILFSQNENRIWIAKQFYESWKKKTIYTHKPIWLVMRPKPRKHIYTLGPRLKLNRPNDKNVFRLCVQHRRNRNSKPTQWNATIYIFPIEIVCQTQNRQKTHAQERRVYNTADRTTPERTVNKKKHTNILQYKLYTWKIESGWWNELANTSTWNTVGSETAAETKYSSETETNKMKRKKTKRLCACANYNTI